MLNPQKDDTRIDEELHGKTLKVYWFLLERGGESGVGVRQVQRALGFSSPRLATYHLEKLEALGLVENRLGEYFLVKQVRVGVLKHFLRFGRFLLPRHLFYATMFSTFLVYIVVKFEKLDVPSVLALVLAVLGSAIFWYETVIAWKEKP